jgi:Tfp pilus assembly protein PilZ
MDSNEDRRKFPRFNLLVDVAVTKHASSGKEEVFPSKNISQGGVCLITLEQPTMGEVVDLKIRLPGIKDEIKIMGKVVWINGISLSAAQKAKRFEVGMEFVGLSDEIFEKIQKYLYNNLNS